MDPTIAEKFERPTDPTLLAYWLMAQAALCESPTGVDGLAQAVLALLARPVPPAGPKTMPVLDPTLAGKIMERRPCGCWWLYLAAQPVVAPCATHLEDLRAPAPPAEAPEIIIDGIDTRVTLVDATLTAPPAEALIAEILDLVRDDSIPRDEVVAGVRNILDRAVLPSMREILEDPDRFGPVTAPPAEAPVDNQTSPPIGALVKCLCCAQEKRWAIWCKGVALCIECRERAQRSETADDLLRSAMRERDRMLAALEKHTCPMLGHGVVWCSTHRAYHAADIDAALAAPAPEAPKE